MSIRELDNQEIQQVSGEGAAEVLAAGSAICAFGAAVTVAIPPLAAAAAAYAAASALFGAAAGIVTFMQSR